MSYADHAASVRSAADPLSGDALLDAYNQAQRNRNYAADALRAAERAVFEAKNVLAGAELLAAQMGKIMKDRQPEVAETALETRACELLGQYDRVCDTADVAPSVMGFARWLTTGAVS